MATEFISQYRKPGFPKTSDSESAYRTTLEYVGPLAELETEKPTVGAAWGDFAGLVKVSDVAPIMGTDRAMLTVVLEYTYDGSEGTEGTLREISFEVEWVMFTRSLFEHPEFSMGGAGTYALLPQDLADIENWKNEANSDLKGDYKFNEFALTGSGSSAAELTSKGKMFAKGIQLGQETYEDYAPVIRKTSTYVSGNPGESTAGAKGGEPSFPGKPAGYEWRKSADRAVKSNGQTRWDRVEEWVGAKKVLTDKDAIYWTAPT